MPYNDVLPPGAEKIPFIQDYLKLCRQQLPADAPPIDPKQVTVNNRIDGDGKYQIIYNNPKHDVYCSAEVNWKSNEINVLSGKLSEAKKKKSKTLGAWEITDACDSTQKLFGNKDEFAGQTCEAPKIDAKVAAIQNSSSFKLFRENCVESLSLHGQRFVGQDWRSKFDLNNVKIVNDIPEDGIFNIIYESTRQNFFCNGTVDASAHGMSLEHGTLARPNKVVWDGDVLITDACTITKAATDDKEVVGECNDRTESELKREHYIGAFGLLGVMAFIEWKWRPNIRLIQGIWRSSQSGRLASFAKLPWVQGIARNLPWAYLGAKVFDSSAEALGVQADDPTRKYGTYIAGGVGLVAPTILKRTIATKLAERSILARAGTVGTRLAGRALLVGLVDMVAGGMINDYNQDVNRRVTDRVYNEHVYKLDNWDFAVIPLLGKGVRASARFLAPNMMEWAVARDPITNVNQDILDAVLKGDRDDSDNNLEFMRQTFSILDSEDVQVQEQYRKDLVEKLKTEQTLSAEDSTALTVLRYLGTDASEKLKSAKGWSDEQFGEFMLRVLPYQIQNAGKFMISVEQDHAANNWAREVFNQDGTIKIELDGRFLENVYFPVMSRTAD